MDDVKIKVARNIKLFRESNGMTQKELAEKLNVGISVISNWEMCTNSPSIVKLFMMCQIFEVTPSLMMGALDESEVQSLYAKAEPKIQRAIDNLLERPK